MNWLVKKSPTGIRFWQSGIYTVESGGPKVLNAYGAAGRSNWAPHTSGYKAFRRNADGTLTGLGRYGKVSDAKARCERDATAKALQP